jgi:hypothetical protein
LDSVTLELVKGTQDNDPATVIWWLVPAVELNPIPSLLFIRIAITTTSAIFQYQQARGSLHQK